MLLKYTVSNFKSIGHDIEFSMFPTTPEVADKYVRTINTKVGNWKILRRGAFYGPNASGKTGFGIHIKTFPVFLVAEGFDFFKRGC